jgi:hypothetical protein
MDGETQQPILGTTCKQTNQKTHPTGTQPMHFPIDPCTTISNMIESIKLQSTSNPNI